MQGYEFSAKKTYLLFWWGVFFLGGRVVLRLVWGVVFGFGDFCWCVLFFLKQILY